MTAISVTAEHIANGVRSNCERCPVALAIRDAIPDITYIAVGPDEITIQPGSHPAEVQLNAPLAVTDFVWGFDDGDHPGPFTFDLDYPAVTR